MILKYGLDYEKDNKDPALFNGLDVFKFLQQSLHFPLVVYVIFLEGAQDLNIFEANKCFKHQPLPQGILRRLSSKVPQ